LHYESIVCPILLDSQYNGYQKRIGGQTIDSQYNGYQKRIGGQTIESIVCPPILF
jgi:hypothetical protein